MSRFIFSILTAVAVGGGIAFAGIEGMKMITQKKIAVAISSEEIFAEEDPTFISHFSRAFIYSTTEEKISISDLPGDFIENTKENREPGEKDRVKDNTKKTLTATSYSMTSLETGEAVIEKASDRLLPIASITKLATAAVARRMIDPDDAVEITSAVLHTEGNTGKLRLNEKIKAKELLYPLLMVSSNDAAEALARHYDSIHGRGEFIKEMNNWANSIGAYRTYFRDPSGISPNNLSSASDISVMAKWILENDPDIFDITLTKAKSIRSHTWVNPTHFLNLAEYIGGKNGYTPEADRTNVSLFALGVPKKIYSVVLLGSTQRDADTLMMLNEVAN